MRLGAQLNVAPRSQLAGAKLIVQPAAESKSIIIIVRCAQLIVAPRAQLAGEKLIVQPAAEPLQ